MIRRRLSLAALLAVRGSALRAAALLVAAGVACAGVLVPLDQGGTTLPPPPWRIVGMPLQTKPFTRFSVLRVEADHSYGNLVHVLDRDGSSRLLSWRWRVELPNEQADLRLRSGDDSAVEVCAMFDLPLQALPFVDRQLVRLARQHSNELLPTATVCYVWDAHLALGTVLNNAYTRRIRIIVLRGPKSRPGTWANERRDVRADFLRLFGNEASEAPPLVGVGIGADADNTQTRSLAYVADLALEP